MKRVLLVVLIPLLVAIGCASGTGDRASGNEDVLIDVVQELGEKPPTYLYNVLVGNISGSLVRVNAVTIDPAAGGDVRFKNGTMTTQTNLEPGEQGEFRIWVDIESDTGFFDREGPSSLRVVISYTIDGQARSANETIRVRRPQRP